MSEPTSEQIKEKAEIIVRLTKPLLQEVQQLHEQIYSVKQSVQEWRKQLIVEDLPYIDYSKILGIGVTSKRFIEMLEDRLTRSEAWAKAALDNPTPYRGIKTD